MKEIKNVFLKDILEQMEKTQRVSAEEINDMYLSYCSGNEDAYYELLNNFTPTIYSIVTKYFDNEEDIADGISYLYIYLAEYAEKKVPKKEGFYYAAYKALRKKAIDYKDNNNVELLEDLALLEDDGLDFISKIENEEIFKQIIEYLDGENFSEKERRIISARYGLNGEDVTSLRNLGKEFGLSREGIRLVELKILAKLHNGLEGRKIQIDVPEETVKEIQNIIHEERQKAETKKNTKKIYNFFKKYKTIFRTLNYNDYFNCDDKCITQADINEFISINGVDKALEILNKAKEEYLNQDNQNKNDEPFLYLFKNGTNYDAKLSNEFIDVEDQIADSDKLEYTLIKDLKKYTIVLVETNDKLGLTHSQIIAGQGIKSLVDEVGLSQMKVMWNTEKAKMASASEKPDTLLIKHLTKEYKFKMV